MDKMAAGARHFLHTCLFKLHFVFQSLCDTKSSDGGPDVRVFKLQAKPGDFVQNQMVEEIKA